MKIVYLVCNFVKNDSRVIKIANSAQNQGYDVTIIGFQGSHKHIIEEDYENLKLILFPKKILKNYVETINSKELFSSVSSIFKKIKQIEPDIIYSHDIHGLIITAKIQRLLSIDTKYIPWIHDCHEYMYGSLRYNKRLISKIFKKIKKRVGVKKTNKKNLIKQKNLVKKLNKFCKYEDRYIFEPDTLISVSPSCAKKIKYEYNIVKDFSIIYNCPNESSTIDKNKCLKKDINIQNNEKIMVWSGSVNESRRTDIIVKSLKFHKNFHLAILTNQENDYINELKSIAKNDNSEKRLHILPMVKQNEVSNYIRNVDYGVHAASDENENNIVALPNKLFEYLHAKIPIIVSDVETMKNFVETNNLGYVFNSGSVESFVEILNEAEKKKKKLNLDNKKLLKTYSWENQEEKLLQIYKDLERKFYNKNKKFSDINVLQLPTISSNQPYMLSKYFEQKVQLSDHLAISESKYNHKIKSKIIFSEDMGKDEKFINYIYILIKISKSYDIFHFHCHPIFFSWKKNFKYNFLDLPFLKSLQKKIVFTFRGSEARMDSIFKHKKNFIPTKGNDYVRNDLFNYVKKYSDHVTVLDPELKSYYPDSEIIPRVMEEKKEINFNETKSKITFLHCPSNLDIKGTKEISKVFNKLKLEGHVFDYVVLQNKTHDEIISEIKKADVIIDQMVIGWYGVFALEAMSYGKPVVSYIDEKYSNFIEENKIPIINSDLFNLEKTIKSIINSEFNFLELQNKSFQFAKNYHSLEKIGSLYLKLYQKQTKVCDIDIKDQDKINKLLNTGKKIRKRIMQNQKFFLNSNLKNYILIILKFIKIDKIILNFYRKYLY